MNRSTPGLPVHHQLPEFTQTHVHQVGDAIQLGTKTIKKKKSTFLLFALSHETLIGFGSHAQVNSEDIINISKTVMIIFSKTSQVGLSPPQPIHHPSLSAALGRGSSGGRERPRDLAASLIPKGSLPDSQAEHYWPRHLDPGHKCSGETAPWFLQSQLPGEWGRGVWKGFGPQTRAEQRFSTQGNGERDRWGN